MRRIALLATAGALLLAGPAGAQPPEDCAALADLKIEDTNLLSAAVVPATDDLPAYCRVLGYVRPAINFEIRLPTQNWNGKFYMAGCGAWCGKLEPDRPGFTNAMNHGLRRNYAAATMDGGHWGSSRFDTTWLQVRDPIARFDHEQRAVTETARVTKEVIAAYYGRAPERSYFAGCSNGGRQANMEAWKYPDDFDGIISGCPWLYAWREIAGWVWNVRANIGADGGPIVDPAKLPMLAKAVYAACAGEDGLIEEPARCGFTPVSLACQGADGPDCLNAAEVQTLEKWYSGPEDSSGRQIYPGLPFGSEPYWSFWLALEDEESWRGDKAAVEEILRFYGFPEDPGPDYDVANFDFDRDPARMIETYVDLEAGGTDLSEFQERGGKLLVYQGLADADIVPEATRQWYEALATDMGGAGATADFARLFLVPGMSHCGIPPTGPGVATPVSTRCRRSSGGWSRGFRPRASS